MDQSSPVTPAVERADGAARPRPSLTESVRELCRALQTPNTAVSHFLGDVAQAALSIHQVQSAALFLSVDQQPGSEFGLTASSGEFSAAPPDSTEEGPIVIRQAVDRRTGKTAPVVFCLIGARLGWLGVQCAGDLSAEDTEALQTLVTVAALGLERNRLTAQVHHYQGKVEVLNELNKLVSSGAPLERICRTLAREAAFRFAADCTLALTLTEDEASLEVRGSYGCPPRKLPSIVALEDTQIGRIMQFGGIMSVPDLGTRKDYGLDFLQAFGIRCVHCGTLETQGQKLGILVIGYRDERILTDLDNSMIEEFTHGAAAALSNAKSQDKLSKYTEKLEELVAARTADLAVQTARADEANRAKSDFVANMSHELRTPLTAIVGYSSILAEGVFGAVNEQQKDALEAVGKAAEHLKELIDDVLNVSKIEAGKEEVKPGTVDVAPLLQQVYRLMLQTAVGKGVQLIPLDLKDEEAKGNPTKLWADPRHIRQVLINIMSNAVKYTPTGGSVTLSMEILGDKAKISVKDTGVGISQEQSDKLFERYKRLDDEYSKSQVGTGIGLSLTKHLVEINGGMIGCDSEIGKGSTFWIMMPLFDQSAAEQSQLVTEGSGSGVITRLDGLNVLVVDDNQATCEVLKALIAAAGGNPFVAHTVPEAKALAKETVLDTALVDLALPGESGLELISYFRRECKGPEGHMPIIVVSACVFDNNRAQAHERGCSEFIAKPFQPSEVLRRIRELTTEAALLG